LADKLYSIETISYQLGFHAQYSYLATDYKSDRIS